MFLHAGVGGIPRSRHLCLWNQSHTGENYCHFKGTVTRECDAAQVILGLVELLLMPNGEEKPIAFASRSLSSSEQNYSHIDKEALGLIYGVRKFHTYLYGRKFTMVTDHKPLTSILGHRKGVSAVAVARLQRWFVAIVVHL